MIDKVTEAKRRAKETYDSAADHFDHNALGFWARYGRSTVERLSLRQDSTVLDVCCGSGASAIPAASIVGCGGRVIGVDLSESMLELARNKAHESNLCNIEFKTGDMSQLHYHDKSFDAVVCVFGIFFMPDMESQVAELWRMVKPGGKLAITTWGEDFFEPAYGNWKKIVKSIRPDLYSAFVPWDRISQTESLRKLMQDGGASNIKVVPEVGEQALSCLEDWWTIALGSGLRWTIDQLDKDQIRRVKETNLSWIEQNNVTAVGTSVIYAVAEKKS